jgi:hypothetical protein
LPVVTTGGATIIVGLSDGMWMMPIERRMTNRKPHSATIAGHHVMTARLGEEARARFGQPGQRHRSACRARL